MPQVAITTSLGVASRAKFGDLVEISLTPHRMITSILISASRIITKVIAAVSLLLIAAACRWVVVPVVIGVASVFLPGMRVHALVAVVAAVTAPEERAPPCFELWVRWVILVVISAHD